MSRGNALIVGICAIVAVVMVSVVLVVQFDGHDAGILVPAIIGFAAPTVVGFLALLQGIINSEKADAINAKVDGHLSRLTQVVVDNAASGTPIDAATVRALAQHTETLTGRPITVTPKEGTP